MKPDSETISSKEKASTFLWLSAVLIGIPVLLGSLAIFIFRQDMKPGSYAHHEVTTSDALPPALEKSVGAMLDDIEARIIDNEKAPQLRNPSLSINTRRNTDELDLNLIIRAGQTANANAEQQAESERAAVLLERLRATQRAALADMLENTLISQGINAEVVTKGKRSTTLRVEYILMSKPLIHSIEGQSQLAKAAYNLGFTKIIYTDGQGATWEQKL